MRLHISPDSGVCDPRLLNALHDIELGKVMRMAVNVCRSWVCSQGLKCFRFIELNRASKYRGYAALTEPYNRYPVLQLQLAFTWEFSILGICHGNHNETASNSLNVLHLHVFVCQRLTGIRHGVVAFVLLRLISL